MVRAAFGIPLVVFGAWYPALSPVQASETKTYIYDPLGRLLTASTSGGPNNGVQSTTTFDPAGNRSTYTVAGASGGPSSLLIANASATEGNTLAFTVTRSGTTTSAVTVHYATSDGTAIAGSDYTPVSGNLSFAVGETTKTVNVVTIDDTATEGSETVLLNLSSPTGGATLTNAQATGTIAASDATTTSLAIANAPTVAEGSTLVFAVTRSGSTTAAATVNYASSNGSAVAGQDYAATSGTLTFAPGETNKTINVPTIDDIAQESNETVFVSLSAPSAGVTVTNAQATGIIAANDLPSIALQINNAGSVPEGGTLIFPVSKLGTTGANVTVQYATADGTGIAGINYIPAYGTLTFGPTDSGQIISVVTLNDGVQGGPFKTVLVNLTMPNGATISDAQGSGTMTAPPMPTNHPPITVDDLAMTTAGASPIIINVGANDSDPDGDTLNITSFTGAHFSRVGLTGTSLKFSSAVAGTFTATYHMGDGRFGNTPGTVTVTVQ